MIIVNSPMFIQIVAIDTEIRAQFGWENHAPIRPTALSWRWPQPPSLSQWIGDTPNQPITSLSTPMLGWSSTRNTTDVIATEAARVDENTVRQQTMPGSGWLGMLGRD